MTRLTWGALDERFYEAGVDRGVLYPNGVAGVAWNGLTSVRETPNGGDAKPYYVDGFKYANVAAAEEFEATIEAFSSPSAFAECDGTASISNGLFVTHQPRKSFGLSYRTKIGNGIDGADHGYKLHLIYNALAAPASRDNNTLGGNADVNAFSWSISTKPPAINGYRPTAHFVVDSRMTPSHILGGIEDLLYGSTAGDAELPTVDTLLTIFAEA